MYCASTVVYGRRSDIIIIELLNQGFPLVKLKSSLWKFYGRHHDLANRYGASVSQMTMDVCSICRKHFSVLSSFMTYHRVCNYSNTMSATSGAGTAYLSEYLKEFSPGV